MLKLIHMQENLYLLITLQLAEVNYILLPSVSLRYDTTSEELGPKIKIRVKATLRIKLNN